MAYLEDTADRMRQSFGLMDGLSEKKMMGGICFLHFGNMVSGTYIDKKSATDMFMFRVGKDNEADAIGRFGARPLSFTGRKMGGMVEIETEACSDDELAGLVALSMNFVGQLPAKRPK